MIYSNILLIDDDSDDREIFESALNEVSNTATCTSFSNAYEALLKLDQKELNPDVIFLDLNMPFMSGKDFLQEIKSRDKIKNIPVIIFSTASDPLTINLMMELGAIDFITKPDNYVKITALLKALLF